MKETALRELQAIFRAVMELFKTDSISTSLQEWETMIAMKENWIFLRAASRHLQRDRILEDAVTLSELRQNATKAKGLPHSITKGEQQRRVEELRSFFDTIQNKYRMEDIADIVEELEIQVEMRKLMTILEDTSKLYNSDSISEVHESLLKAKVDTKKNSVITSSPELTSILEDMLGLRRLDDNGIKSLEELKKQIGFNEVLSIFAQTLEHLLTDTVDPSMFLPLPQETVFPKHNKTTL